MLKLKIPPPAVGLVCVVLLFATNHIFNEWSFTSSWIKPVVIAFVLAGLAIELFSVSLFFRKKTTVNPFTPQRTQQLVTDGLYRFTRNPMYVGMLLMLCGLALWLGNPLGIVSLGVFWAYITEFQIKPEEAILQNLFGDDYRQYQQSVRRWL